MEPRQDFVAIIQAVPSDGTKHRYQIGWVGQSTSMANAMLDRYPDGSRRYMNDACNLGTGADGYFEAYELAKKAGIHKPEYLDAAINTCEFVLRNQFEDGSFAKSWHDDWNFFDEGLQTISGKIER